MSINERTLMNVFRDSGQDFTVDTIELRNPFTGDLIGTRMLYRTDTKDVMKVGVSDSFEPIQNVEILQILRNIGQFATVHVIRGGIFDHGKVGYLQFSLGRGDQRKYSVGNEVKKDFIEKRFTLFYHHDGRAGVYVLPTPYVFGEDMHLPGLSMTHSDYSPTLYNVRHSRDLPAKMNLTEESVNVVLQMSNLIEEQYTKMYNDNVSLEYCMNVLDSEFPIVAVSPKKETVSRNARKNLVTVLEKYQESYYNIITERDLDVQERDIVVNKWTLYKALHRIHQYHPLRASANDDNHEFSVLNGNVRNNSQALLDGMMVVSNNYEEEITIPTLISAVKETING